VVRIHPGPLRESAGNRHKQCEPHGGRNGQTCLGSTPGSTCRSCRALRPVIRRRRVPASQAEGRGFEARRPLSKENPRRERVCLLAPSTSRAKLERSGQRQGQHPAGVVHESGREPGPRRLARRVPESGTAQADSTLARRFAGIFRPPVSGLGDSQGSSPVAHPVEPRKRLFRSGRSSG
jgi:hypothetical protein